MKAERIFAQVHTDGTQKDKEDLEEISNELELADEDEKVQ